MTDISFTDDQKEMHPAKWLLHLSKISAAYPHKDNDPLNDQIFRHEIAMGMRYAVERLPNENLTSALETHRDELDRHAPAVEMKLSDENLQILRDFLSNPKIIKHLELIKNNSPVINILDPNFAKIGNEMQPLAAIQNALEKNVPLKDRVFIPHKEYPPSEPANKVWDVFTTISEQRCFLLQEVGHRQKMQNLAQGIGFTGELSDKVIEQVQRALEEAAKGHSIEKSPTQISQIASDKKELELA